ncbi:MAG: DUF6265 family protein [Acidobacteriota bacterium]|nr:DUF6265 family protein [Acidobacteriota bacterium]
MRIKNIYCLLVALALVIGLALPATAADANKATLDQLSWMTGDWRGEMASGGWIEERWSQVAGKSLVSAVRMVNGDATPMVELIIVEEEANGIVLRLQQWNPGFEPRSPAAAVMTLKEVGDKQVWFEAPDAKEGLTLLGYSSPAPGKFSIHVQPVGAPQPFEIKLSALK